MTSITATGWLRQPRADAGLRFLEDDDTWRYVTYEDLAGRVAAFEVLLNTIAVQTLATPDKGKLVFHKYGDEYFLSQVWKPGANIGNQLRKTQREIEVAAGRVATARSTGRRRITSSPGRAVVPVTCPTWSCSASSTIDACTRADGRSSSQAASSASIRPSG